MLVSSASHLMRDIFGDAEDAENGKHGYAYPSDIDDTHSRSNRRADG
jgi:hypothetical protein